MHGLSGPVSANGKRFDSLFRFSQQQSQHLIELMKNGPAKCRDACHIRSFICSVKETDACLCRTLVRQKIGQICVKTVVIRHPPNWELTLRKLYVLLVKQALGFQKGQILLRRRQ